MKTNEEMVLGETAPQTGDAMTPPDARVTAAFERQIPMEPQPPISLLTAMGEDVWKEAMGAYEQATLYGIMVRDMDPVDQKIVIGHMITEHMKLQQAYHHQQDQQLQQYAYWQQQQIAEANNAHVAAPTDQPV